MDVSLYKDYIFAEVTLFWTDGDDHGNGRLIFALTELIPKNQLPSEPLGGGKSPYLKKTIRKHPKIHILCRRYFCSIEQAVSCFEQADWSSLSDGPVSLKMSTGIKREPTSGFSVVLSRCHIPFSIDVPSLSMVLPNRSTSFRAYAFVDDTGETRASFTKREQKLISKLVNKCCGIEFIEYGEFFGSNVFCMQNPIIWDYKSAGIQAGELYLLLLPRDKQSVEGMRCMLATPHTFGLSGGTIQEISSEVVALPRPQEGSVLYLWDREGHLLEAKPLSFFGQIQHISLDRRELPDGTTTAIWPDSYYRPTQGKKGIREIYEERRMYDQLEKRGTFFYFRGGAEEKMRAERIIRRILTSSGIEITICDPYFTAEGFKRFIKGWVKCKKLTIFVSEQWINFWEKGKPYTRLAELDAHIQDAAVNIKSIELYGILGKRHRHGCIHDRFIIADAVVYCLGASLCDLASRDTVLIKSPNPEVFQQRVEELKLSGAKLLQSWGESS